MNAAHLSRLQRIFREIFDQPSLVITPTLSPAELSEWDSVAMVQIVLATEQEFGVRLTTDQVAGIKNVQSILAAIEPQGR